MDLQDNLTPQKWKHERRIDSFKAATEGIKTVFQEEVNFKIHCGVAIAVIVSGLFLKINHFEWVVLAVMIGNVFALEMVNTAIENTVDLFAGNQWYELAKKAKDLSAAAVFVMVISSIIVGMIIFIPYLIKLV